MKVVVTDTQYETQEPEQESLRGLAELVVFRRFPGSAELVEAARDADAVLCQEARLGAEVIDHLQRCRVIIRYGVGYDNIDVEAASRKGIVVCNVPDYGTQEVADHTVMLALALIRKLPRSMEYLRSGGWSYVPLRPIPRVSSLTVGIYGLGRIGRAAALRYRAFGCPLLAYDPYLSESAAAEVGVERVDEETLLARSDLLSLHVPLTTQTRHALNRDTFAQMKPGALLVNTARGAVVDTDALTEALDSGRIGGAALDVLETEPVPTDHPLWTRPNVILTGHLAWYSEASLAQLQRSAAEECARVLRGEPPWNPVNLDALEAS